MKKRKDSRGDYNPEDRKRKLNFKKKKQRFDDKIYFDPKKKRNFDEFEDDQYE